MISFIRGILSEISENFIVVDACGVGYGINVPATLIPQLPSLDKEVKIYTHFSVREDGQTLYGFLHREDREMFRQLLSVNGIGPKGALGILSVLKPDELRIAIISGDAKAISRAPGIGAKTAQRVILDLKDKIDAAEVFGRMSEGAVGGGEPLSPVSAGTGPYAEAMEALVSLGYSRSEALSALRKSEITDGMSAEEILKTALRNF